MLCAERRKQKREEARKREENLREPRKVRTKTWNDERWWNWISSKGRCELCKVIISNEIASLISSTLFYPFKEGERERESISHLISFRLIQFLSVSFSFWIHSLSVISASLPIPAYFTIIIIHSWPSILFHHSILIVNSFRYRNGESIWKTKIPFKFVLCWLIHSSSNGISEEHFDTNYQRVIASFPSFLITYSVWKPSSTTSMGKSSIKNQTMPPSTLVL